MKKTPLMLFPAGIVLVFLFLIPIVSGGDVQIIQGSKEDNTAVFLPHSIQEIVRSENVSSVQDNADSTRSLVVLKAGASDEATSLRPGIEWQRTYGASYAEEFASIHQTTDGGYIGCGMTDAYYANGDVTAFIGNGDAWVVKLYPNGTPKWQRAFGGRGRDECRSIRPVSDGYILVGFSNSDDGVFTNKSLGGYDIYVVKLRLDGSMEWQQLLGGAYDEQATSIRQTSDGGYILTGYEDYSGSGKICQYTDQASAWVMKLNPDGTLNWQKKLAGNNGVHGTGIIETTGGLYLLYGFTGSTSGDGIHGNHGSSDLFVAMMDHAGTIVWSNLYGGSGYEVTNYVSDDSVQETADGDFIMIGQTTSNNNGDVGKNHGRGDIWLLKIRPDGTIRWQKTFGGSDYDMASGGIIEAADGGFLFAGMTQSSDSGDVGRNNGGWDFWAGKVDADGNLLWQEPLGGNAMDQSLSISPTIDGGCIVAGRTDSSDTGDVGRNHGESDAWVVKLPPHLVVDVYDTDTQQSVSTAMVSFYDLDRDVEQVLSTTGGRAVFNSSDSAGQFRFVKGGNYSFSATADKYRPGSSVNVTFAHDGQMARVGITALDRPAIEKTFSITNAWVEYYSSNDPPFEAKFDGKKYITNITRELKENAGWTQAFPEINGTNIKKAQFGVNPSSADRTLNDATLHWHLGHGGLDSAGHTAIILPTTYNPATGDFDGDWLYPGEVTQKWGGKNKWVVLQDCWILQDPEWGTVLGTTHGIFGFTTPTVIKSALPTVFLQYAKDGKTLHDSWYDATTELYHGEKMGTTFIMGPDGKLRLDNYNNTVNISAAVRFKTRPQRDQDHLPGLGLYIAPDGDPANSESVPSGWDCTTGERVNP
jgi:hypothetical protein